MDYEFLDYGLWMMIMKKDYGFLSCAKTIHENIVKNISKNLSGKCSHKILDHARQYGTDAIKTFSKRAIQNQQK